MTVKQLKQYRSICAEIEEKNIELNEGVSRDTVRGSDKEFPYIQHTIKIAGITEDKRIVHSRILQLKKTKQDIEHFIDSIDDSLTRRIFEYRYIKGKKEMTWCEIAIKIGGGNSPDSVRKAHERFLRKN